MPTLERSLRALDQYIHGGSSKHLRKTLAGYKNRETMLQRDFYDTNMDHPELWPHIEVILRSLGIPPTRHNRYRRSDWKIADFLAKLSREGHIQVAYFLDIVEKRKAPKLADLVLGGLLTSAVLSGVLAIPAVHQVIDIVRSFLGTATGMPIVGIFFSSLYCLYTLGRHEFDKRRNRVARWRDHAFVLASAAFTFAAYGVWMSAAPVVPMLAASLFVAASVVLAVRELFCLAQYYWAYQGPVPGSFSNPLEAQKAQARHEMVFQQRRNSTLINLATAFVLIGLVGVWSFLPPSIVLSMGMMAIIAVVLVVQHVVVKYNERVIRERLQTQLQTIENHGAAERAPSQSVSARNNVSQDLEYTGPTFFTPRTSASPYPALYPAGQEPAPRYD